MKVKVKLKSNMKVNVQVKIKVKVKVRLCEFSRRVHCTVYSAVVKCSVSEDIILTL